MDDTVARQLSMEDLNALAAQALVGAAAEYCRARTQVRHRVALGEGACLGSRTVGRCKGAGDRAAGCRRQSSQLLTAPLRFARRRTGFHALLPAQRHAKLLHVSPQALPDAACAPLPPRRPPRRLHTRSGGCSSTLSWSAFCSAAPLWRQSATGRASLGMSRTS